MAKVPSLGSSEIRKVLSKYQLGSLRDWSAVSSGTVQENILVETTQGRLFLKPYRSRSLEYVGYELRLLDYLNKHQFACPKIYPNIEGNPYEVVNGKAVAIYEWLAGEHRQKLSYSEYDQLIRKVAELHLITADLRLAGEEHRWNYGVSFGKHYIDTHLSEKKSKDAELKKDFLLKELDALVFGEQMTKGIVHGDLDPSNLLFQGDQLSAILDFDDANYTFLVLDLVGLLDRRSYKFLGSKYFELIRYVLASMKKFDRFPMLTRSPFLMRSSCQSS